MIITYITYIDIDTLTMTILTFWLFTFAYVF